LKKKGKKKLMTEEGHMQGGHGREREALSKMPSGDIGSRSRRRGGKDIKARKVEGGGYCFIPGGAGRPGQERGNGLLIGEVSESLQRSTKGSKRGEEGTRKIHMPKKSGLIEKREKRPTGKEKGEKERPTSEKGKSPDTRTSVKKEEHQQKKTRRRNSFRTERAKEGRHSLPGKESDAEEDDRETRQTTQQQPLIDSRGETACEMKKKGGGRVRGRGKGKKKKKRRRRKGKKTRGCEASQRRKSEEKDKKKGPPGTGEEKKGRPHKGRERKGKMKKTAHEKNGRKKKKKTGKGRKRRREGEEKGNRREERDNR